MLSLSLAVLNSMFLRRFIKGSSMPGSAHRIECLLNHYPITYRSEYQPSDHMNKYTFTAPTGSIGFLEFTFGKKGSCFLDYMELKEPMRGQHLGSCLYQALEQTVFRKRCDQIALVALPERVGFWARMGYQPDYSAEEHIGTVPLIKSLSSRATSDTSEWYD
jgi:hypothetical protein